MVDKVSFHCSHRASFVICVHGSPPIIFLHTKIRETKSRVTDSFVSKEDIDNYSSESNSDRTSSFPAFDPTLKEWVIILYRDTVIMHPHAIYLPKPLHRLTLSSCCLSFNCSLVIISMTSLHYQLCIFRGRNKARIKGDCRASVKHHLLSFPNIAIIQIAIIAINDNDIHITSLVFFLLAKDLLKSMLYNTKINKSS